VPPIQLFGATPHVQRWTLTVEAMSRIGVHHFASIMCEVDDMPDATQRAIFDKLTTMLGALVCVGTYLPCVDLPNVDADGECQLALFVTGSDIPAGHQATMRAANVQEAQSYLNERAEAIGLLPKRPTDR
jgi:hypothetical protein